MKQNEFSQIIIELSREFVILSSVGIARWLENKSTEDIISPVETKLGEVLDFEPKGSCIYLKVSDTVEEARERFTSDIGKMVVSVLVSEHGKSTEKPINIITPWDFVAGALK
jgi:hypothetical protein